MDHGNAWNTAAVSAGGVSRAIDTGGRRVVSAFGHSSAATTIMLQFSQDNTDYYDGPGLTLDNAGDFVIDSTDAARYVRLASSAAATITATIAAKRRMVRS